jgi:hypothetical protein
VEKRRREGYTSSCPPPPLRSSVGVGRFGFKRDVLKIRPTRDGIQRWTHSVTGGQVSVLHHMSQSAQIQRLGPIHRPDVWILSASHVFAPTVDLRTLEVPRVAPAGLGASPRALPYWPESPFCALLHVTAYETFTHSAPVPGSRQRLMTANVYLLCVAIASVSAELGAAATWVKTCYDAIS